MSVWTLATQKNDATGKTHKGVHVGATNGRQIVANGVMALLDADTTIEFETTGLPEPAPAGTLNLVIESYANVAATQSFMLRVLWAPRAAGVNFDTQTLNDEHSAGDLEIEHTVARNDMGKITRILLDAVGVTYGTHDTIRVHLDLKTTGWDLAVPLVFKAYLKWI